MDYRPKKLRSNCAAKVCATLLPLICLASLILTAGCDQVSSMAGNLGVTPVKARTPDNGIESFQTYQEALVGKGSDAVVEAFGKPKGIFEKRSGKVWMYSRWCVEFDSNDRVVRLERDIASNGSRVALPNPVETLIAKPKPAGASSSSGESFRRISNGGQNVDLSAIVSPGKITIVDFYADWCGPCRQISPHLEKIASDNPDVVLVKVDIVKWGTPVTRQYGINSVPNVRVFNSSGQQVGEPTYKLSEVQSNIAAAR